MSKYNEIKAALLGAGTVGGGVYKLIEKRKSEMPSKIQAEFTITKVLVKNLNKKREGIPDEVLTNDWQEILDDQEISIVIELMGGIEPARTYILEALKAGKNVVTANKDLLAEHGKELMDAAEEYHKDLYFEAAVGGGIPIIRPLKECLAGNNITEVMGIVNGTTNFILTKMTQEGMEFKDALALATELGYAEADPTADIEGHDACRKIAILSSLAFGKYVDYEDVYTEGITKITSADFAYAKVLGSRIKLFGTSKKKEDGSISAMVCPVMITNEHPLFAVNDVMNAILVRGESMGDLMFYGAGAGKLPTASAVVADVVNAARNPKITEIAPYEPGKMTVSDHLKSTHSYFVRVKGSDANAVAESFKAKQIVDAGIADEFGLITAEWAENEFDALCENYPVVSVIRLAK